MSRGRVNDADHVVEHESGRVVVGGCGGDVLSRKRDGLRRRRRRCRSGGVCGHKMLLLLTSLLLIEGRLETIDESCVELKHGMLLLLLLLLRMMRLLLMVVMLSLLLKHVMMKRRARHAVTRATATTATQMIRHLMSCLRRHGRVRLIRHG